MKFCDAQSQGGLFRQPPVSVDLFIAVARPVFLRFRFLRGVRAICSPVSVVMIFLCRLGVLYGIESGRDFVETLHPLRDLDQVPRVMARPRKRIEPRGVNHGARKFGPERVL